VEDTHPERLSKAFSKVGVLVSFPKDEAMNRRRKLLVVAVVPVALVGFILAVPVVPIDNKPMGHSASNCVPICPVGTTFGIPFNLTGSVSYYLFGYGGITRSWGGMVLNGVKLSNEYRFCVSYQCESQP
jgi:hypothetical protein